MELCVTAQVVCSGSWPCFCVIKIWNLGTRFIKNCIGKVTRMRRELQGVITISGKQDVNGSMQPNEAEIIARNNF